MCEMDITPGVGDNWLCGYGWSKDGVVSSGSVAGRELRAQCAVLWDYGTPNVLMRLDVANITRGVNQRFRGRLEEERLIGDQADFIITSSHTPRPVLGLWSSRRVCPNRTRGG